MAKQIAASTLGTPNDTYLYTLAKSKDEKVIATIGSDDALRLFDPTLTSLHSVPACHQGLSCLTFGAGAFYTAGRDGLIKQWDPRATRTTAAAQLAEPQNRSISALTQHGEHYIAAGTDSTKEGLGDVSVLLFDTRNPAQPLRTYSESHTDSITQLAFHPNQPNLLLSASTDGLVSFFDINQADEDDALQRVLNPKSAVHCSGFLNDEQAYVLTTDEVLSIYPLADKPDGAEDDPVIEFGDVRDKLNCMYVIDVLHQNGAAPLIAYGHNNNQTLSIAQLDGGPHNWAFGPVVELVGAHGEEVVRDIFLVQDQSRAYSCGEDGHVRVWDLAAGAKKTGDANATPRKKRREKKADRFAPY